MSRPESSNLAIEEYRALRATIRERGTVRSIVIVVTFVAWALLFTLAHLHPFGAVATLVLLAAGFEIVYALHVGVERVGRYLQARYESSRTQLPTWEHEAMEIGGVPALNPGADPLGSLLFIAAVVLNLFPWIWAYWQSRPLEGAVPRTLLILTGLHALVLLRIVLARRFASRQRAADLEFFRRP